MDKLKTYLKSRMESLTAWIGFLGIPGELLLHRDPSTLMFVLFVVLIVAPESFFRDLFKSWSNQINTLDF